MRIGRYKIKHDLGNNDYLSIQEWSRAGIASGANNELYPDVIVIDGGLGQLHAAMEVFTQMDVKPPMVISLAEEGGTGLCAGPQCAGSVPGITWGLKLLQYLRDEAHRLPAYKPVPPSSPAKSPSAASHHLGEDSMAA